MLDNLSEANIIYDEHANIRLGQRGISKELLESLLRDKGMLLLARKNEERGNFEVYLRKSSKYTLKVVLMETGTNQLKVITAHLMNRKKWQKSVKLWPKMPR